MIPCKNVAAESRYANYVGDSSEYYMANDLRVRCDSGEYQFGVVWAVIMMFVYPIGLPYLYYSILKYYQLQIEERKFGKAEERSHFEKPWMDN